MPLLVAALALLPACDFNKLAAGSYPYAERINVACSYDAALHELRRLKNSGSFGDTLLYRDERDSEHANWYHFTFFCQEANSSVHLWLSGGKASQIGIVSVYDLAQDTGWKVVNNGLEDAKKKQVLRWFDRRIRPALQCHP
jgi:hypothetical protein